MENVILENTVIVMPDYRNIQTPAKLVKEYDVKPSKKFGQNFITKINLLEKITNLLEVKEGDFVIEFGSGPGTLAAMISMNGAEVIGVEKSKSLIEIAKNEFPDVEWIEADMRRWDPPNRKAKLVGNLPYYLTSFFIRRFLKWDYEKAVFMIQKEVGERILAKPKSSNYGLLSVIVQGNATVNKALKVGKGNFYPQPGVDSIILEFVPKKNNWSKRAEELAELVFMHRRQTLFKSLKKKYNVDKIQNAFERCNIDNKARPEELSSEDYISLEANIS